MSKLTRVVFPRCCTFVISSLGAPLCPFSPLPLWRTFTLKTADSLGTLKDVTRVPCNILHTFAALNVLLNETYLCCSGSTGSWQPWLPPAVIRNVLCIFLRIQNFSEYIRSRFNKHCWHNCWENESALRAAGCFKLTNNRSHPIEDE